MSCNEYYGLQGEHRRQVLSYVIGDDTPVHVSMACNHCLHPVCMYVCDENNFLNRGMLIRDY